MFFNLSNNYQRFLNLRSTNALNQILYDVLKNNCFYDQFSCGFS